MLRLESLIKHKKEELFKETKSDQALKKMMPQLIVIGHSFGAALTYSALSQIFLNRFIESCYPPKTDNRCRPKGFGDLVILLNPAFEAIQFEALHSIVSNRKAYYDPLQLPLFVILNSEADWATKYAFLGGHYFSRLFELEREEEDQKNKNITSIGHYEKYQSYKLSALDSPSNSIDEIQDSLSKLFAIKHSKNSLTSWWTVQIDELKEGARVDELSIKPLGVRLSRKSEIKDVSPYLLISVDKYLIPGHSEIYDWRILNFINLLMLQRLFMDMSDELLEDAPLTTPVIEQN